MVNKPTFTQEQMRADNEIADFAFGQSGWQQISNPDWTSRGIPAYYDGREAWEAAKKGEVTTYMFLDNPAARTATLGITRLRGDWQAADDIQQQIVGPDSPFRQRPFNGELYHRASPEANRVITIDWGIISIQGLTTVTSRRRMLKTEPINEELDAVGLSFGIESVMEVDKVSTFALDITKLEEIDKKAADEVRLIIICGMLAGSNIRRLYESYNGVPSWLDYQADGIKAKRRDAVNVMTAREKMKQYEISPDLVIERLRTEQMNRLYLPETVDAIEDEITNQRGLLIPSTSHYYAERKLRRLNRS